MSYWRTQGGLVKGCVKGHLSSKLEDVNPSEEPWGFGQIDVG